MFHMPITLLVKQARTLTRILATKPKHSTEPWDTSSNASQGSIHCCCLCPRRFQIPISFSAHSNFSEARSVAIHSLTFQSSGQLVALRFMEQEPK
jgi:hypothetical protein